ncbi:hypothetical protein NJB1604_05270 [Mycobacterium marinum]|uniref:serpin family protein n=1 Tax=Mycobacterium marinum TaxID=1781 RepID=UPI0021C41448|nr:serpin family protein [Mycobacterium marinum]GJO38341.1 hypothetical protein NJB1604_05270 [Mycobacterium marinum]
MDVGPLITRYARRFCRVHAGLHSVTSPLGAWLLLALVAPVARGAAREQLEEALGTDAKHARQALEDLMAAPPEVINAALALWGPADLARLWSGRMPSEVEIGPIPSQAQADTWARNHTDGMIERFPADLSGMAAVLASALATRISWLRPFGVTDAGQLRSPWSKRVCDALTVAGHSAYLADAEGVGTVGVHTAVGTGELHVTSVIASRGTSFQAVLAAAHDIACREVTGSRVRRRELCDLPLGDGEFWTITEGARGREDDVRVVMPAWQVSSDHDLTADPALGFGAAGQALAVALKGTADTRARQSAVARYGRYGFEAAAVTAIAVRGAMVSRLPSRSATLRFGHPYAVVAVVGGGRRRDPWAGVPVFAAWVSEPTEVGSVQTG